MLFSILCSYRCKSIDNLKSNHGQKQTWGQNPEECVYVNLKRPITKLTLFLATSFLQRLFHKGMLLKCMEAELGLKETSESSLGEKFDDLSKKLKQYFIFISQLLHVFSLMILIETVGNVNRAHSSSTQGGEGERCQGSSVSTSTGSLLLGSNGRRLS